MKKLDHPNIVKLYEIIDDPLSDKLYLVMPVAEFGQCIDWDSENLVFRPNQKFVASNAIKYHKLNTINEKYYDEDVIRRMSKSLISALDYLHSSLNIVHRDIKPQNIMIDENGNPLLVDFGKAQQLLSNEDDNTSSMEGTYTFLSPECCSFDVNTYSMKKADIWALGITLYILAFNKFPFDLG